MYESIAESPMSSLLLSMWKFSYARIYCRSSYERFVGVTVDVFLCINILKVLL